MTHKVDTAFDRTFSEPPNVAVSAKRTHCEACQEPLASGVMHKCHGNQEYKPAPSHTEITETCPDCYAVASLGEIERIANAKRFVVVCTACRTFVHPETTTAADAIFGWNSAVKKQRDEMMFVSWPKWLADLPGDDETKRVAEQVDGIVGHPDLTNYKGVCPTCNGTKGTLLDAETGAIDPCTHCDGKGVIE